MFGERGCLGTDLLFLVVHEALESIHLDQFPSDRIEDDAMKILSDTNGFSSQRAGQKTGTIHPRINRRETVG